MIDFRAAILDYLKKKFDNQISNIEIYDLGSGLVAEAFRVTFELTDKGSQTLIFRRLHGSGMSRDYLADRISYLTLQHEIAKHHPQHTKSWDVVVYGDKTKTVSIEGITDAFQVMELAEGDSYLKWISEIANLEKLDQNQKTIIYNIANYLQIVHSIMPEDLSEEAMKHIYWRHSQDYVGSEVLMDILDVWPTDKYLSLEDRKEIIANAYELRESTRQDHHRITKIHADLHPDNIRVHSDLSIEVLDASRTIWGEPTDDIACILSNFIYFYIRTENLSYLEAYDYLVDLYTQNVKIDVRKYLPLFLSIRLLIVAHPIFFSHNTAEQVQKLIQLAKKLLELKEADFVQVRELLR